MYLPINYKMVLSMGTAQINPSQNFDVSIVPLVLSKYNSHCGKLLQHNDS